MLIVLKAMQDGIQWSLIKRGVCRHALLLEEMMEWGKVLAYMQMLENMQKKICTYVHLECSISHNLP